MTQYYGQPQWPGVPGAPYGPGAPLPPPSPRRRRSGWFWALIIGGVVMLLSCAGLLGFIFYVGSVGPDTKVYVGNEVPARFVTIAQKVGVLDPSEQVRFFYSDAITDVEEGFYLCTDKKVAIYIKTAAVPATVVRFDEIEDVTLVSSTSWAEDGSITLHLGDDSIVTFPVSSEGGRDVLVHQHIKKAIAANDSAGEDVAVEIE